MIGKQVKIWIRSKRKASQGKERKVDQRKWLFSIIHTIQYIPVIISFRQVNKSVSACTVSMRSESDLREEESFPNNRSDTKRKKIWCKKNLIIMIWKDGFLWKIRGVRIVHGWQLSSPRSEEVKLKDCERKRMKILERDKCTDWVLGYANRSHFSRKVDEADDQTRLVTYK